MKKLSIPIEHFTDLEKITEIYNDLMTRLDTVVLVRQDDDMIVFHRDGKTTKIKMPSDRIAEIEKIAQVLANGGNTDDL